MKDNENKSVEGERITTTEETSSFSNSSRIRKKSKEAGATDILSVSVTERKNEKEFFDIKQSDSFEDHQNVMRTPDEEVNDLEKLVKLKDIIVELMEKYVLNKVLLDGNSDWRRNNFILIAVIGALICTLKPQLIWCWVICPIFRFFSQIVGVALGLGFGLGLATHVYDHLNLLSHGYHEEANLEKTPALNKSGSSKKKKKRAMLSTNTNVVTAPISLLRADHDGHLDDTSYASLMASAGYNVATIQSNHRDYNAGAVNQQQVVLRGQVLYRSCGLFNDHYPFTDIKDPLLQTGPNKMIQQWPMLPKVINVKLGTFIDHIMRDYVSSWYSLIDEGCVFEEESAKQKQQQISQKEKKNQNMQKEAPEKLRSMVFSMGRYRKSPLLEHMYHSLSSIFGNLSLRAEQNVNVFSVVLLKWTQIFAHTFKVYRSLRKLAMQKKLVNKNGDSKGDTKKKSKKQQQSKRENSNNPTNDSERNLVELVSNANDNTDIDSSQRSAKKQQQNKNSNDFNTNKVNDDNKYAPSEMEVTKEFLFAGKLHKAITFGLDVPSLLFSDSFAKECGAEDGISPKMGAETQQTKLFSKDDQNSNELDEDEVLERRFLNTKMLQECENDYNRVLAYRMCRALLPRNEFSSPLLSALTTEILASTVLTPTMGCFSPDFINSWIIQLVDILSGDKDATSDQKNTNEEPKEDSRMPHQKVDRELKTAPLEKRMDAEPAKYKESNASFKTTNLELPQPIENEFMSDQSGDSKLSLRTNFRESTKTENSTESKINTNSDGIGISINKNEGEFRNAGNIVTISNEKSIANDNDEDDDNCESDPDDTEAYNHEESGDNELNKLADNYISLLAIALTDFQKAVDSAIKYKEEKNDVNWEDDGCKTAVVRLVLIVEAIILHGRRALARRPILKTYNKISSSCGSEHEVVRNFNDDLVDNTEELLVEVGTNDTANDYEAPTLSQILMEMTSDIYGFENRLKDNGTLEDAEESLSDTMQIDGHNYGNVPQYEPSMTELSTTRTLIAAWLHTGQLYKTMVVLCKAHTRILYPYYHTHALIRTTRNANKIIQHLKVLDCVEVLVDTIAMLSSPKLNIDDLTSAAIKSNKGVNHGDQNTFLDRPISSKYQAGQQKQHGQHPQAWSTAVQPGISGGAAVGSGSTLNPFMPGAPTPRYLDFHKNEAFASSLRVERERRLESWNASMRNDKEITVHIFRTKGSNNEEMMLHRELHHIARIFYAGTNLIAIRNAATSSTFRRGNKASSTVSSSNTNPILATAGMEGDCDESKSVTSAETDTMASMNTSTKCSLLTLETACARRKIEVPDDDSSFLLRAQPRNLNAVGVHRDPQNHDLSFQCFAATYEEPTQRKASRNSPVGRYMRRCLIRYYPSDRTASVAMQTDNRKLDQRKIRSFKGKGDVSVIIKADSSTNSLPFLPTEFLRERHLCQKWGAAKSGSNSVSRGASSILSSSIMESTDFNAAPRTGKALDFIYKMSFFERTTIDLSGKKFTCHDSSSSGAHRADASALEISDAALSAVLLAIGEEYHLNPVNVGNVDGKDPCNNVETVNGRASPSMLNNDQERDKSLQCPNVQMGPDGYPLLYMRFSRKSDDKTSVEMKPYRLSFVRAALMIASTRQEAQLQCLIDCVRAGSVKSTTKTRIDKQLWPTLRLLDYANSRSREKQSIILRDLKLGINHIDREQLRRNALLNPRYPTYIHELSAKIESPIQSRDVGLGQIPSMANTLLYRIRVCATIEFIGNNEDSNYSSYSPQGNDCNNSLCGIMYHESWVIYRTLKDFQTMHKHLKTQVAASETSGTAGSRLVGAATAAFTVTTGGSLQGRQRQRQALIPSLGQSIKTGALGISLKAGAKRAELLNAYLCHLLLPGHLLNRCSELLLFLGVAYPLPSSVTVDDGCFRKQNPHQNKREAYQGISSELLGRSEMKRVIKKEISNVIPPQKTLLAEGGRDATNREGYMTSSTIRKQRVIEEGGGGEEIIERANLEISRKGEDSILGDFSEDKCDQSGNVFKSDRIVNMIPAIASKIDEVPLALVRNRIFELLRYQFGFENASFLRNRMLSALKTASFAVTTNSEFRKILYKTHVDKLNPNELANWLQLVQDLLWPNGVFMSSTKYTNEQLQTFKLTAKQKLHSSFSDQLRTILGQDLTRDGLDIMHEMLQNRVVVKSMAYMIFDVLWLEVFPEIRDIVTCGNALDIS